jgi:hypothetical protein
MLQILAALVPVVLVIGLGGLLYRQRAIGEAGWSALEHLCYYLLLPALIVRELATQDFGRIDVAALAIGYVSALMVAALSLILLRPLLRHALALSDPAFTSVFQAVMRWHGFIALAVAAALFGTRAVPVVAIGLASLVPVLNVMSVLVLLRWGERREAAAPSLVRQLSTNPFIIACGAGAALNASGLGLPEPAYSAVNLLANCALGVSLLTIGAGLRPLRSQGEWGALLFGVIFRLMLMPLLFFATLTAAGVSGDVRTFAVLCGAVPTASSAYVLARKLGGDAPLMANMTTAQMLAAAVTLPVVIWLLRMVE